MQNDVIKQLLSLTHLPLADIPTTGAWLSASYSLIAFVISATLEYIYILNTKLLYK